MRKLLLTLSVLLFAAVASAQTLRVATGSPKGTYATMFKELQQQCGSEVALSEIPSTGSMENINLLVGNQVNAAFVQSDVLHLRSRTEELGNVKTLLALHGEALHFVARVNSGIKEGGTLGIGAKEVVLSDVANLGGRRIGAAGGSAVTAQVVRLQSEIPFNVVPFDTNDAALAALLAGNVEAVLLVGGHPLGSVAGLDGKAYKLLTMHPSIAEKLKGVYRPTRVSYPKLGAQGVPTVMTEAIFVTREYKTAKMTESLSKFRACALDKLEELKETTGTHPAWQAVDGSYRGKWPWYELPASVAAVKPRK